MIAPELVAALPHEAAVLGQEAIAQGNPVDSVGDADVDEVRPGGENAQALQAAQGVFKELTVAYDSTAAALVFAHVGGKRPDHGLGDAVDIPMRQRLPDDCGESRLGDGVAQPDTVQAEVLAKALQDDDVGPLGRLARDRRDGAQAREVDERFVDDHDLEVSQEIEEPET